MNLDTTYANLGVVPHSDAGDPLALWRAHFYDGKRVDPIELLFDEEPEHRAIEQIMLLTDTITVGIYPPMLDAPKTAEEAEERLLATARGLKSVQDEAGMAALVTAAISYQTMHREAEQLIPPIGVELGSDEKPEAKR
jgi:hypothetical protein